MRIHSLLLLVAALGAPRLHAQLQASDTTILWVSGGDFRLKTAIFKSPTVSAHPTLVVVLHGDSPFRKPDYQDRFAASVTRRYGDVVAAAILRPGYTDPAGNTSDGDRGETTGDNYNATNVDAIAEAITALQRRFQARRVILVGHSGGAAISADIMGRHPAVADGALLVSCPCDVTRWREHMFQVTKFDGFTKPITTLSPIDLVGGVRAEARIVMMVGDSDNTAPPVLDSLYLAAAAKAGRTIRLVMVPGKGHDILLEPPVLETVGELLKQRD